MRKLLLATIAASALAVGSAYAADLPARVDAPAPAPIFTSAVNWTGFYIGGHAGGTWSSSSFNYTLTDPNGGPPFTSGNYAQCGAPAGVAIPVPTTPNPFGLSTSCNKESGFLGGVQLGYDVQSGSLVYGVVADFSWRELKDRQFGVFGANPSAGAPMGSVATDSAYMKGEQGAVGTLRGKLGFASGSWLIYATGGVAVGQVNTRLTEVLSPGTTCVAIGGGCQSVTKSDTNVGWTAGAGVAWKLTQSWSIGAEYLFVDLGKATVTRAPVGGFFNNTGTMRYNARSHVARATLNYHFGAPAGPVIAKY